MDDASPHRLDEESAVTSEGRGDQPGLRPSDLPDPSDLPELRIYSRSSTDRLHPCGDHLFLGRNGFRIERSENSRPP